MNTGQISHEFEILHEGQQAALAAIRENCPHPEGSDDRHTWLEGFRIASEIAEERHQREEAGEKDTCSGHPFQALNSFLASREAARKTADMACPNSKP